MSHLGCRICLCRNWFASLVPLLVQDCACTNVFLRGKPGKHLVGSTGHPGRDRLPLCTIAGLRVCARIFVCSRDICTCCACSCMVVVYQREQSQQFRTCLTFEPDHGRRWFCPRQHVAVVLMHAHLLPARAATTVSHMSES